MAPLPDFPLLDSPAKCAALWTKYPRKVVGLWATGQPRQNVDVLWRLREELLKLEVPVVFFFNESARTMLGSLFSPDHFSQNEDDIFQLDDAKFFRLLNFVEVLVTNDYFVDFARAKCIRAKLVGMPHCANTSTPGYWNYFYDYFVSDKDYLNSFNFNFYSDYGKIHRNESFTQLVVGYPKMDLIFEERNKVILSQDIAVLLIYPTHIGYLIQSQNISHKKYFDIWSDVVSSFHNWRSDGIVILRPTVPDRHHPLIEQLKARFAQSGRFFLDEEDDNKFWLARARYFVTDISMGFVNFCMTAKKPAIRMNFHSDEDLPTLDEWGWTISSPAQVIPLLAQMDRNEKRWDDLLTKKQKLEMPTLGRNFALLAEMIKRIYNNDDDSMWLKLDKGHTPCKSSAEILKLVAKWTKHSKLNLVHFGLWIDNELNSITDYKNIKILLLLLRRSFISCAGKDWPNIISKYLNTWLGNALEAAPFRQSVGLIRYLLRRYSHESALSLLITASSVSVPGHHKKRALFFLLMEWAQYDPEVIESLNELAQKMPQHFSLPVLDKLNRFLPLAMKVPLPLRRFAARILGLKKPLTKKYWEAHRALS